MTSLFLSAFFSASETAFSSANILHLRRDSKKGKRERLCLKIYENLDKYLVVILLGNNLVNISISAIASAITIILLDETYAWISTAISTFLVIVLSEIFPKEFARKKNKTIMKIVAYPLSIIYFFTYPLLYVFFLMFKKATMTNKERSIQADEIEYALEEIEKDGLIDNKEAELLQNSIDFEDEEVFKIAVNRLDIEGIDIEDDDEKIIKLLTNTKFSRLIVYEGDKDAILGAVMTNDILEAVIENKGKLNNGSLKKIIKKNVFSPLYFHKTMTLSRAFIKMKNEKKHIAIINDEFGGTYGMITMEDIIEELSGDIWDETDKKNPNIITLDKNVKRISGDVSIEMVFEEMECELPDEEIESNTIGGLASEILDRVPKKNDVFTFGNLKFRVETVKKRRVKSLIVRKDYY